MCESVNGKTIELPEAYNGECIRVSQKHGKDSLSFGVIPFWIISCAFRLYC